MAQAEENVLMPKDQYEALVQVASSKRTIETKGEEDNIEQTNPTDISIDVTKLEQKDVNSKKLDQVKDIIEKPSREISFNVEQSNATTLKG